MVEHLEENIPDVTDIHFTSLWSSYVRDNEIKVFFEYEFKHPLEDQMTRSQLKGWALLNPTGQDIQESWSIKKIQIDKQSIDYEAEPIIISASGSIEEIPEDDATDGVVLPDREGVKNLEDVSDKKSMSASAITTSTSMSKSTSDVVTTSSITNSTLQKVETPTSSTVTTSITLPSVDLKK